MNNQILTASVLTATIVANVILIYMGVPAKISCTVEAVAQSAAAALPHYR
jgi:hypothetical protein